MTKGIEEISDAMNAAAENLKNLSERMKQGPLGALDALNDANERAANDPKAVGWLTNTPYKDRTEELRKKLDAKEPDSTAYGSAKATVQGDRRYFDDINDGGGPQNAEQRADYAKHKASMAAAEATMQAEIETWRKQKAEISQEISRREVIEQRGKPYGGPKARLPARSGDQGLSSGMLSPTLPSGAQQAPQATAVPTPPQRPAEITAKPQVDTSQIDQASQLLQGVDTQLQKLNGASATVTVQPQGMDAVRSQLQDIIRMMDRINNGSVHMPSGGPGRAGAAAPVTDVGVN